jgi:energy-coupling factor transporter ATP-binding protein EcfA2
LRSIICRTLRHEYRLRPPDAETGALLRFVAAEPELPDTPLEPVEVPIARRDGFLAATMPSGAVIEGTASHLVGAMHRIAMGDLAESYAGAPFVHGATVVAGGRRLLVVGHKGCGKSTLALHLALAGHDVEGDEHLLIGERHVIARPRTLRVKEGSFALVGGLPASVLDSPSIINWDGTIIRAISPAVGGRPWVIRPGRLAGIVFLVANHGGRSAARPIRPDDAFGRLMREIMLPESGVAAATARLRRLVLEAPAYQLLLGNLETAEWHLRQIAKLLT